MTTILLSIVSTSNLEELNNLLSNQSLLSPQEVSYLQFILDSYNNSNSFPSPQLLSHQFTELSFSTTPLQPKDLSIYIANFLHARQNLKQSQLLMKIATEVSQSGLTQSHIDQLSSLIPQTSSSNLSFQDYYLAKKDKPQGIITNIKSIDENLGGLPYGNVLSIFGYVASYKSMLANNIAYHNAINLKYNIVIFSLEVPKEQCLANLITRHSALTSFDKFTYLPTDKINRSLLSPEEEDYLFNTILPDFTDYQSHGKIIIYDQTDFQTLQPSEFRSLLLKANDDCISSTGYPLDAFIVDHINLCKFTTSKLSVLEQGNLYVAYFTRLAQSFKTLDDGSTQKLMCVLLVQANRTGWKKAVKNKGAYDLTAISEFNEVERSSQAVLSVFTSDEMKLSKEASVQLLKNRFGPTVEDPQVVYAEPKAYTIGDEMASFNDSIELDELESVFSEGSIADLFN